MVEKNLFNNVQRVVQRLKINKKSHAKTHFLRKTRLSPYLCYFKSLNRFSAKNIYLHALPALPILSLPVSLPLCHLLLFLVRTKKKPRSIHELYRFLHGTSLHKVRSALYFIRKVYTRPAEDRKNKKKTGKSNMYVLCI